VFGLFVVMSGAASVETPATCATESPYRRTLTIAVSAVLHDAGFAAADEYALETLTEMLQSCELLLI